MAIGLFPFRFVLWWVFGGLTSEGLCLRALIDWSVNSLWISFGKLAQISLSIFSGIEFAKLPVPKFISSETWFDDNDFSGRANKSDWSWTEPSLPVTRDCSSILLFKFGFKFALEAFSPCSEFSAAYEILKSDTVLALVSDLGRFAQGKSIFGRFGTGASWFFCSFSSLCSRFVLTKFVARVALLSFGISPYSSLPSLSLLFWFFPEPEISTQGFEGPLLALKNLQREKFCCKIDSHL